MAADVYSVAPHVGRGGWTWYTGSAGWLYRAGIESILGLKVKGDRFEVAPCLPAAWPGFEITLTLRGSVYEIEVRNPVGASGGVVAVELSRRFVRLCLSWSEPMVADMAAQETMLRQRGGVEQEDLLVPLRLWGALHRYLVVRLAPHRRRVHDAGLQVRGEPLDLDGPVGEQRGRRHQQAGWQ